MSLIDTLVTDRTQADVDRLMYLFRLFDKWGSFSGTAEELAEWNADPKGAYHAADLNRVGDAVAYLAGMLNGYGYSVAVSPKKDWTSQDTPTASQMQRYLDDVSALRAVLAVLPTTPEVPPEMEGLTYTEANDIEQILKDIESVINTMITTFVACGEATCGGDYL